jgi:GalNAc-alpha-(1->4)-GalNAc-alpha-(1->3)-diNAcBac-PP-undecaprenol alpha-1,4-N-acetyl-D-galactosaminyltransferase
LIGNGTTRLTLVISSLAAGGAERVMATLANAWAARGRRVTLLTFDDGSAPPFYPLDSRVDHRPLNLSRAAGSAAVGLSNNVRRVRALRRALGESRPDAVISFMTTANVNALLAASGLNAPVVISERVNPDQAATGAGWKFARRVAYRRAAAIVAQTEREAERWRGALKGKVHVIPNPVAAGSNGGTARPPRERKEVVAAGRLEAQKGFDLLLRAFAALKGEHRDWRLTVWGEGSERGALESLSRSLQINDRVSFPGRTPRLADEFSRADLFVLPSRYEGFPNVLAEAMACGLPVIAADCDYGPREIVRHGADGLLVPCEDAAALTAAMSRLMADGEERGRLTARAVEAADRFSLEKILLLWERLLDGLAVNSTSAARGRQAAWQAR